MIVSLKSVAFDYGGNSIFSCVDFDVNEGEKIGLVGANGEGKTTLLKLICGELEPESGDIFRKNGARIGYLEQSGGFEADGTLKGELLRVFSRELSAVERLETLGKRLSEVECGGAEYIVLSQKIEGLKSYVSASDAYNVEVRVNTVLNGMGFSGRGGELVATLSGGEKTRLKLARLLLEEPDLLLLDEPTNHLDSDTLFWLEDYIKGYKGALVVVSHDRYFLDGVAEKIAEIENGGLVVFKGNYSKYKILKAERFARLEKEWLSQCEERERLQTFVDKNIVRATTAKSAQSRVKRLNKMEILEKPYSPPQPPRFNFTFDGDPAERVLTITDLNLERGGKRLISAGQLQLKRGDKLALVGANGTGKSSLIDEIAHARCRAVQTGRGVRTGVYDQENKNLSRDKSALSELWERHVGYTQTEARAALARAGLKEDDISKPVSALSGGERAKLALCVLEGERANFLLMDEPTNHLDLPARESLEESLKSFGGTLIVVSHDRYFLAGVATRVAEISDGGLKVYDCDFEGYLAQKRAIAAQRAKEQELKERREYGERREGARQSRAERAEAARRKDTAKRIEGEIVALEEEESKIYAELSKKEVAADYGRTRELTERLGEIKISLDALYKQYESVL